MGKKEKENPSQLELKGLPGGSQTCRRKPHVELPSLTRSLTGLSEAKEGQPVSLMETKMHAATAHPVLRGTLTAHLGVRFLQDPTGRAAALGLFQTPSVTCHCFFKSALGVLQACCRAVPGPKYAAAQLGEPW